MMSSHGKRHLLTALKWIFSGAMLVYALHAIDPRDIGAMLAGQLPLVPLAVIALYILQMLISTFRWQRIIVLLSPENAAPKIRTLFDLNFISIFFNSCLPGTIGGDVVRAMMLKSEKLPLTLSAHSVIIDRLMAVIAIYVMVTLALPWLGALLPALPTSLLFAAAIAGFLLGLVFLAKVPELLLRLPTTHFIRMIVHVLQDLSRTIFVPDFLLLMAQAIVAHVCFCFSAYLLAQGMGVDFTFVHALLLIPPVLLLIMLPISIGGWGVREVSMVSLLALAGVPHEAALAISVQLGLLQIIASLPGAWIYARRKTLTH